MSLVLQSSGGGQITIQEPATASNFTQTLPAVSGTIITTGNRPAGSVLQVVSVIKTDTFSGTALSTWTDITGVTASITPTSASSKILVMVQLYGASRFNGYVRMVRGSTPIFIGDAAGSRPQTTFGSYFTYNDTGIATTQCMVGLDSPATTSSTNYKIQFWLFGSGNTFLCNRCFTDSDNADIGRGSSSITLMEIAG